MLSLFIYVRIGYGFVYVSRPEIRDDINVSCYENM